MSDFLKIAKTGVLPLSVFEISGVQKLNILNDGFQVRITLNENTETIDIADFISAVIRIAPAIEVHELSFGLVLKHGATTAELKKKVVQLVRKYFDEVTVI